MEAKKPRGRPKIPFDPYMDELDRRLRAGVAKPTLEAEADWLADWGKEKGLKFPDGKPLQKEQIRERIKKRCGGTAQAYKNMLDWHLSRIELDKGDLFN